MTGIEIPAGETLQVLLRQGLVELVGATNAGRRLYRPTAACVAKLQLLSLVRLSPTGTITEVEHGGKQDERPPEGDAQR